MQKKQRSNAIYSNTVRQLTDFTKRQKVSRALEDITPKFFRNYEKYLVSKGYADGYIHRLLKAFKTVMNEAVTDGLIKTNPIRDVKYKVKEPDSSTGIYFEIDEIRQMAVVNIEDPHLERIRDIGVIACLCGLRHVDWHRLDLNNLNVIAAVNGFKFVECFTSKTGETVWIPMFTLIVELLEKYGRKMPVIAQQYFNRGIKEVSKIAGIDKLVGVRSTRGGETFYKQVPKWSKISTRTARKSFMSNCLHYGLTIEQTYTMTGHKDKTMAHRYDQRQFEKVALHFVDKLKKMDDDLQDTPPVQIIML